MISVQALFCNFIDFFYDFEILIEQNVLHRGIRKFEIRKC